MKDNNTEGPRWGLAGAIASAFGASACCLGPLAVLALGVGGAWAGYLTAMEKNRPLFSAASVLFVGLAFQRVYRKGREEACASGGACSPNGNR